jgi:DNA-binding beta-propeller fold protein YncE
LQQYKRNRAPTIKARICCLLLCWLALPGIFFPLQVHADGGAPNLAYVACTPKGVSVIDVAQQKVSGGFAVPGGSSTILLSPDGGLLYITQPASGQVTALAAKTGQMICTFTFPGHPALLAMNIDRTVLYAAGVHETTIVALDAQTCALQHSFQTTQPITWLAAAGIATGTALSTQLWVAGTTAVSILDEQGQLLDSIPIGGGPRFLCLPNELTAYIATGQDSVVAVDMVTHQVFASLLTGGTFGSMDYDAVTGDIYVPDAQHDQVDVLSPVLAGSPLVPQEPKRIIRVSGSPRAIAVTNDGQFGFVALSGGKVDMLDIPGRRVVKTFLVGGEPSFIITGPYPPSVVPTPRLPTAAQPNIPLLALTIVLLLGVLLGACWFIWRHRFRYRRVKA